MCEIEEKKKADAQYDLHINDNLLILERSAPCEGQMWEKKKTVSL